ncbi:UDP-N-acetylmuramate dehydrogenase [bacterium]|nr:UDP-N-acetylmuramate dehydrogenase [bacterium]
MTDWNNISEKLSDFGIVERDKRLAQLTSFGVGGPAKIVLKSFDKNRLIDCMKIIWDKNLSYYIIGKGTNLLVSDDGFDGIIIQIDGGLDNISQIDGNIWQWQSGISLKSAIETCIDNGFGGIEELAGIPGSVGGAAIMNASAYDVSFFDKVKSADILILEAGIEKIESAKFKPKYRGIEIPDGAILISVELELDEVKPIVASQKVLKVLALRAKNQPIDKKSAGCIFKNPDGMHAGKLIDDAGLKGISINDAMVSPIHSNFIVNNGKASATDIMKLIEIVRKKVFEKYSVELELEVKTLGF